jgi:predicted enzyme related to lactoylglutathione lyase
VNGIGGIFFRSPDPDALKQWYAEHLGIPRDELMTSAGLVWSPFRHDTDYFGASGQEYMVNYRVDDLDGMLERLRAAGAAVDDRVQEQEGIGRFGWAADPDGNRFELWEPAAEFG